jgi:hypothetical protein
MEGEMSPDEFLAFAWKSCIKRVASMIDEYSENWRPNGPAQAVAVAIKNKVLAMPVPTRKK